jgi:beta-phosphoglucomutase-like phosphatase (HAD superfamily)
MIKAIFFDFNGVIIDDETIQMKAYQEVLSGHQISLQEEWYFEALGMNAPSSKRCLSALTDL